MVYCKICRKEFNFTGWGKHVGKHKREYLDANFGKWMYRLLKGNTSSVCWGCVLDFNKVKGKHKHTCQHITKQDLIIIELARKRRNKTLKEFLI